MSTVRLVADVGGTNVRVALADETGSLASRVTYRGADFTSFAEVLTTYLKMVGDIKHCSACAIGAAGPVDGDRVRLTNTGWAIDRTEISTKLSGMPVALVNDLEAVAAALPHLAADDVDVLGGPAPLWPAHRTMLAVNVGTGFGAASAILRGGSWWTCPSEAGHMTLGSSGTPEVDLTQVGTRIGGASIESLLSGKGVAALYKRLAQADDGSIDAKIEAGDVLARARNDAAAARTVQLLTASFAWVAGDLALASAAWGGVYLCGSVALGWSAVADIDRFRVEFTQKGAMSSRMQEVPTVIIRRKDVALFGLAKMAISH